MPSCAIWYVFGTHPSLEDSDWMLRVPKHPKQPKHLAPSCRWKPWAVKSGAINTQHGDNFSVRKEFRNGIPLAHIGLFLDDLIVIEDIEGTRPAEVVRGSCPAIQVCELPFAGRASTHATRALMPWCPDACRNIIRQYQSVSIACIDCIGCMHLMAIDIQARSIKSWHVTCFQHRSQRRSTMIRVKLCEMRQIRATICPIFEAFCQVLPLMAGRCLHPGLVQVSWVHVDLDWAVYWGMMLLSVFLYAKKTGMWPNRGSL